MTILGAFAVQGQESEPSMTLEQVISIALENNHGIRVANLDNEINQKNVHIGNAGFLPKVDLTGQASISQNISDLEFASPAFPAVEGQEAGSTADQAQVQLSYLLFNGGARLRTWKKLKKSGELSDLQERMQVEGTLMSVVNAYFEVVRLEEAVAINQENVSISSDRFKRAKAKFDYGGSNKVELLNAEVDYNSDQAELLSNELNFEKAKHQMNYLMGRSINSPVLLKNEPSLPSLDSLSNYQDATNANNSNLLLAEVNLNLSEIDQKINRSNLLPVVSTNFSYGYQGSTSDVGVVKSSSSLGFTGAISLTWNLFDGLKRKKALEQAKLKIESSQVAKEQAALKVDLELNDYYQSLQSYLSLLDLEKANLELAQLSVERSKELYENGTISSVQFRQSQLNQLYLKNKVNNYRHMAIMMDFQLKRLKGELIAL